MQWQLFAGRAEGSLCRISGLANTQNSHIWNASCPGAENNCKVISEEREGESKTSIKLSLPQHVLTGTMWDR